MNKEIFGQGVSILMPTYKQAGFILLALKSVFDQTYQKWELIIINDGSPDNTEEVLKDYLNDSRITYLKTNKNRGLSYCLNKGLQNAKFELIAYLPSDDVWHENHLELLIGQFNPKNQVVLAYSNMLVGYNYNARENLWPETKCFGFGMGLQLVQVMHKKVDEYWTERQELVTDNLFVMYWRKLLDKGLFKGIDKLTCQYTNHSHQRHKIINRNFGGGLSAYRAYYNVAEFIQFKSESGDFFDESSYLPKLVAKRATKRGLKILLVGELSYNPERICALEEYGHQLYGLWIKHPSIFYNTGPLPYGQVKDLSYENWRDEIKVIKPDIIYALLNEPSINLAHEVITADIGIPFVWHFKEGPFTARNTGLWEKLMELYMKSDGLIYINELYKKWIEQYLPLRATETLILDGDLVKREWMTQRYSKKLSLQDGEMHTLIIGRPLGIMPVDVEHLAKNKVHIHLYGTYDVIFKDWVAKNKEITDKYFHVHSNCHPQQWVEEFSKYDAAWLHSFDSKNRGDLKRLTWHDLNLPARMSTIAISGLPMIQKNNSGHKVATQQILEQYDIGILYKDMEDLVNILFNAEQMSVLNKNAKAVSKEFCFDYKVDVLTQFFEKVISNFNKLNN